MCVSNGVIFLNSSAPGRFEQNFRQVIFKLISVTDSWGISCKIALRWMPLDLTDDKSTLVQVMAWCRQATSHYLNQCWPRFMLPYGVTRPQWVKNEPITSLWPSDNIRWTSSSTLVQVMACCLLSAKLIIWSNAGLIWFSWPNCSEISIEIQKFSIKKMHLKMWAKWQTLSGLILGLRPANERRRYQLTPSLIGWAQD